ncbi:MAG TPA: electron transfer flavoprotein subunit beta/FixA family protein [Spirochaetia bacterium]|nr:electron transfer flavoprotein subunit beta/FixA family protein [Spirochaetia bacterium]
MNIAVLLKQTFDTEAKISLAADGGIQSEGVNLIINPYDEFALEEALRLKEKAGSGEVVVVSAGGPRVGEALRTALATGADRAIHIEDPALDGADEFSVAAVLAAALKKGSFDLILAGWRAVDDGSGQVAIRVAELLDVPQVNVVTAVAVDDGRVTATMDIEGGCQVVEVPLPAVLTAQKGLNEPRYPSMRGIMQAKKKPLEHLALSDLDLAAGDTAPKTKLICHSLPAGRQAGRVIEGEAAEAVRELVRVLREEAKAI